MSSSKTVRNLSIGIVVIAIATLFSYRFLPDVFKSIAGNAAPQAENDQGLLISREVSVVTSWEVPNGTDEVRFTIGLDTDGKVVEVTSRDILEPDVVNENLEKFSQGLLLVIRGKKLSELTSVDRVGKSSLTTAAFNAALSDLQAQL